MANRIELASGHVGADPLSVELIQVNEHGAAVCVIRWPARPTQVRAARLADAVAAACRVLANSSTELSRRRVRRPLVIDDEGED